MAVEIWAESKPCDEVESEGTKQVVMEVTERKVGKRRRRRKMEKSDSERERDESPRIFFLWLIITHKAYSLPSAIFTTVGQLSYRNPV